MEEVNTHEKDWAEALQVVEFLYAQNQELLTQAAQREQQSHEHLQQQIESENSALAFEVNLRDQRLADEL